MLTPTIIMLFSGMNLDKGKQANRLANAEAKSGAPEKCRN
jgi:hypothetical protein